MSYYGRKMKSTKTSQKQLILTVIKFGLSIMLMLWVLRKTNLEEILLALRDAKISLLIVALFIYFLSYYIRAQRWHLLLQVKGVNTSIISLLRCYLIGVFFSNFLPSTVGGDMVRAYDIWKMGASKSTAAVSVFIDRFLGLLILAIFAVGAMLFSQKQIENLLLLYPWVVLSAVIVLAIFWLIFMPPQQMLTLVNKIQLPFWHKLQHKFKNLIKAFLVFGNHKQTIVKGLWLSLIVQISVICHYYAIALALNLSVPFTNFFLIIPLISLIMVLPISINAIGLRENAFVFFFGVYGYGVSRPEAVALAWLAYGIVIIQGLLGGILYGLRK